MILFLPPFHQVPESWMVTILLKVFLEASIIPIQEVVIRRTDPMNLLRLALKMIPRNYSADPVLETAFYRETIRKNEQYIAVSEAVLDIYKPGYDAVATEQTRVIRGRKNMDYGEMAAARPGALPPPESRALEGQTERWVDVVGCERRDDRAVGAVDLGDHSARGHHRPGADQRVPGQVVSAVLGEGTAPLPQAHGGGDSTSRAEGGAAVQT